MFIVYKPPHERRLTQACAYGHSDQNLYLSLERYMNVKLLTKHHLEFLSLTRGCRGSYESTLVKMPLLEITCHSSYINTID